MVNTHFVTNPVTFFFQSAQVPDISDKKIGLSKIIITQANLSVIFTIHAHVSLI